MPVTVVPGPQPLPIAINSHGPAYGPYRWLPSPRLTEELERRNLRPVALRDAAVVADISMGPWGRPDVTRPVEVYLLRDGHRRCAGRILVSGASGFDQFYLLSPWMAEVLARALAGPPPLPVDLPCGEWRP